MNRPSPSSSRYHEQICNAAECVNDGSLPQRIRTVAATGVEPLLPGHIPADEPDQSSLQRGDRAPASAKATG